MVTVGAQLVMVISVVVNTVDVVKDGVGGVTPGVDVMTSVPVKTEDEGVDATRVLVGVVTILGDGVVKTLLRVEVGVVEGLVTAGVLSTTGLLVVTKDGVLEKTDGEVDASTLLIGVLTGNVEVGVEAGIEAGVEAD